jgi:uncharacterized protein (TIGR02466 family)
MNKNITINYQFYHWGPFLYSTKLNKNELNKLKKLCHKKPEKDHRKELAGLLRHEYELDVNPIFNILKPYFFSYVKAFTEYSQMPLGDKIELKSCWVNYMTKFESNPIHTHDEDLSFVIFTEIPKNLNKEIEETLSQSKPGSLTFLISLTKDKKFINGHSFIPEIGDFFIFPAKLHHYVNHFKSKGERISISGNLSITNNASKKE